LEKESAAIASLFVIIALLIAPAHAFVNPSTGDHDTLFEEFGPRIDGLFIKMYNNGNAELTALNNGEIDVTDYWLSSSESSSIGANATVVQAHNLARPYYLQFALNENNETTLGPPGSPDPNPKYPNPMADRNLRLALVHLINWTYLQEALNYSVVFTPTPVLPYMNGWVNTGLSLYQFNVTLANEILNNTGYPIDASTGWRFPDRNHNGVKDSGETWDDTDDLDFYVRQDPFRRVPAEN